MKEKVRVCSTPGVSFLQKIANIVIDNKCSTGLSGVFACGDVTNVPFKQVVIAGGEGAKAALAAYDYIISQR